MLSEHDLEDKPKAKTPDYSNGAVLDFSEGIKLMQQAITTSVGLSRVFYDNLLRTFNLKQNSGSQGNDKT